MADSKQAIEALRDTDYKDGDAHFKMVQLLKGLAAASKKDKVAKAFLDGVSDALTGVAETTMKATKAEHVEYRRPMNTIMEAIDDGMAMHGIISEGSVYSEKDVKKVYKEKLANSGLLPEASKKEVRDALKGNSQAAELRRMAENELHKGILKVQRLVEKGDHKLFIERSNHFWAFSQNGQNAISAKWNAPAPRSWPKSWPKFVKGCFK